LTTFSFITKWLPWSD